MLLLTTTHKPRTVANRRLYDLLDVDPSATKEEIHRRWLELVRKHHPDAGGDANTFSALKEAYEVLRNDERREFYDITGLSNFSEVSNSDAEALNLFHNAFMAVLESFDDTSVRLKDVDLLERVVITLREALREQKSRLSSVKKETKKIEAVKSRAKRNAGRNLIVPRLDEVLKSLAAQKILIKHQIKVIEAAIVLAESHSCTFEANTTAFTMKATSFNVSL